MQRSIIAAVVAAVLLTGWAMPSAAQQNGTLATTAEEYVAPVEEAVPPAEGDYQAYADEVYVEPVPVVEETVVDASTQQEQVLKLPSTGAGIESSMPLAAAAGAVAVVLGATSLRRRLLT